MGAEREDIDPAAKGGTEPGIGARAPAGSATKPGIPPPPPRRGANGSSSAPMPVAKAAPSDPAPVDFDALHAALGEGSREAALHGAMPAPPPPVRLGVAESQGRSSATYASARPHAVPVPHVAAELSAPAVIVAPDDTVPGVPPQMTAPLTSPMAPPVMMPGTMGTGHPSSGPYTAAPHVSSSPMAAAHPLSPSTPQSFAAQGVPGRSPHAQMHGQAQVQLTMRMPERPRRPRTPTVVVRPRGPSTLQKLLVFAVMLLLVSACGIGIVMWRAPQLFGLGPRPAATQAPPPRIVPAPPPTFTAMATATATVTAVPTVAPSASATASAPKPKTAKPAATPR